MSGRGALPCACGEPAVSGREAACRGSERQLPPPAPAIDGYAVDSTWIAAGNEERSGCLRELALARALYRLGDADGLGERALRSYLADPRRVYARHAAELLSEPRP